MIVLQELEPAVNTWISPYRLAVRWNACILVRVVPVSPNVPNLGGKGIAREEDVATGPALDGVEALAVVPTMDQRKDLVAALLANAVSDSGLGRRPRVHDMLAVARLQSEAHAFCWDIWEALAHGHGSHFLETSLGVIE